MLLRPSGGKHAMTIVTALVLSLFAFGCNSSCLLRKHAHHDIRGGASPDPALIATFNGNRYDVFDKGSGNRVVLLLHELPGLSPETITLAQHLAEDGFHVYYPLMFGRYGQRESGISSTLGVCAGSLFDCTAKRRSSRAAGLAWEVVNRIHAIQPDAKVVVIGMCLSGNLGVAVLAHPQVSAAVMSQPSLPFAIGSSRIGALGLARTEVLAANASAKPILAFRFTNDCLSPAERMTNFERALPHLEVFTVDSSPCNHAGVDPAAHAVLTEGMRWNEPEHPTQRVYARLVEFLSENLKEKQP